MKILYIFDEDDKYGAAKAGVEMILEMKNKFNITPIVITSKKGQLNKIFNDNQIENYVTFHHKFIFLKSISLIKYLVKIIPRYIRYKLGNFVAMHIISKKIDMNKIDYIHANNSGLDLGILLAKKYNKPNVIHLREYGTGDTEYHIKTYRKNYIEFFNRYCTKFIAISNSLREFWEKKGLDKNKIETIYDGVDVSKIQKKDSYFVNKKLGFIVLGSISEGKGQAIFLQKINKLNYDIKEKIYIDIVGSGTKEDETKIGDLIRKYNLEQFVFFKGYESDIGAKLKEYDVGVVCSDAEGFGRVTIEYMAAGLCVLASNKGANIELVNNNINGLIYDKDKEDDLNNKIEYLVNNPEQILKLGKNSKNTVYKYSVQKNCDDIIDKIYKEKQ